MKYTQKSMHTKGNIFECVVEGNEEATHSYTWFKQFAGGNETAQE